MSRPASLPPALLDQIRRIEESARHGVLPFGIAALDYALPGGGLALGAVHEISGAGGDEEDGAAAAGFIAGILARLGNGPLPNPPLPGLDPGIAGEGRVGAGGGESRDEAEASRAMGSGPVLWCLKRPDLYGPGLLAHGLDPARLVLVRASRDEEILWALEEGLRAGPAAGLAAIVGELGRLPMVASRRLQLAAERSGVTALIVRRWRNAEEAAAERDRPSAAVTRWRVAALPSADNANQPGIGRPRWRVALIRCRGAAPGVWNVEVADATGHVFLSAELADRPAAPARLGGEPPGASEKHRRAG